MSAITDAGRSNPKVEFHSAVHPGKPLPFEELSPLLSACPTWTNSTCIGESEPSFKVSDGRILAEGKGVKLFLAVRLPSES